MARTIKTVPEMAEELAIEKGKSGYTEKLYKGSNYKVVSDEHKHEMLAADIMQRVQDLRSSEKQTKVNFNSLEDVEQRTYDYFEACAAAGVYPSVMGLAVHGYGISRQALNQYLQRNAQTPQAEFILKAKDMMADILTNESLKNNANAVQVIFQLKNHFEHSDRVEIQPVQPDSLGERRSPAEIMERYKDLLDD